MNLTNGDSHKAHSEGVPAWEIKARQHRATQASLIPPEWKLKSIPSPEQARNAIPIVEAQLTDFEREVTSLSNNLSLLLDKLHSRQWTSVAVTTAFCKRAALLHQLTGCLTEIMFESALRRAKELDDYLGRTGNVVGALHGVPLSLKDNHDIEGVDSTLGWVGLIDHPAKQDHPAVEMYKKLGAVLYVKTNIPQSMMMSDSYNHVWGQSVNSINRLLISGGSSGGEAALVAGGGSVIGVGTDIGGSVRIPATLQGLYGLCPTIGRTGNRESIRRDKYVVPPVAGPLTRDLSSLETFMKAYLGARPWEDDPGILPFPWREDQVQEMMEPGRKFKLAYIVDDGVVFPQPPVQRAVRETVARLKKAGHEVVEWDASTHRYAYELWLKAVLADGGSRCDDLCKLVDEPLIKGMLVGKPEDTLDVNGRMELFDKIWKYQCSYMKMWKGAGIDALIMPVTQWAGLKPKLWVKSDMYVGYTSIWNLLNWTSLTVPAIQVSKRIDLPDDGWKSYKARSFSDQFNHDGYDVDLYDGVPVGLQIVTGRFGEEKAVGIAKVLETLSV